MSAKIKVGLVTSCIDNRQARGTALVARRFLEQLPKFKNEFDFTLIHQVKTDDVIYKQWPEIIMPAINWPVGKTMLNESGGWLKLRRQGIRFDIIHYLQPRVWPSYLLAPAKKIVITVHEAGVMLNLYRPSWGDRLFRLTNKWLHQRMDALIVVSEFGRREVCKYFNLPLNRIHVVPNGLEENFKFYQMTSELKDELIKKYGVKYPFILSVGRFDPHKNIIRLLQAYAAARQQGITEYLILVGGRHLPEYSDQVEQEIKKLNLSEQVIVTPYIQEQDLPKVYSAATALIYPSVHEGFGLPVLEAMVCDCPVAAANNTALPEIAGSAALLFDPFKVDDITKAIIKIINDQKLRQQLVEYGHEQIKKYSWATGAETIIKLYKQLNHGL